MGSIQLPQPDILFYLWLLNESKLAGYEAIVLWIKGDAQCGRDYDIGAACDILGAQMVQVVLETVLLHGLKRLFQEYESVLIILIKLKFVHLLYFLNSFELVCLKRTIKEIVFLGLFILGNIRTDVRLGSHFDKGIHSFQIQRPIFLDSALKNLVLTR